MRREMRDRALAGLDKLEVLQRSAMSGGLMAAPSVAGDLPAPSEVGGAGDDEYQKHPTKVRPHNHNNQLPTAASLLHCQQTSSLCALCWTFNCASIFNRSDSRMLPLCLSALLGCFGCVCPAQVRVVYAFDAEAEGELTVGVDDSLWVETEVDGWYQVVRDTDGARGLVPTTYVEVEQP